jgi:hypothetical protein
MSQIVLFTVTCIIHHKDHLLQNVSHKQTKLTLNSTFKLSGSLRKLKLINARNLGEKM